MNLVEMMKDTFSPHELALLAGLPTLVLLTGSGLLVRSAHPILGLLLFAFAWAWCIAFGVLSLCPNCGKSPWYYRPFGTYRFPWRRPPRLWPEHECSACGTSLDGI